MQDFSVLQRGVYAGGGRLGFVWQQCAQRLKKIPLKRWKLLVMAFILIWFAHSSAQLFWLAVSAPAIPPANVSPGALAGVATASRRGADINLLKDLELFGTAQDLTSEDEIAAENISAATQGPQIEDEAVDTKLKLVLKGVINSSEAKFARAIIANAKTQAIYGQDDELPMYKGVKVAKVMDLRVILDNKGQYESLWLYTDDPNAPKVKPVDLPSRSWTADEIANTPSPAGRDFNAGKARVRKTGSKKTPDAPVSLENVSKKLSDIVAFNIHREQGQVKGYRLRPGRDVAAFDALGLETGDIVTAVNGEVLDNPGKIMEIYRSLGQTTSASLDIERDGVPTTVDVQLD